MARIPEPVRRLAATNDRVVTSTGLAAIGFDPHRADDLVDGGLWVRPFRGVYITHSGPPPWQTRARAALEYAGPGAALSHGSAALEHGASTRAPGLLDVVVPRPRTVAPAPGLIVHRPSWYTPARVSRPGTLPCTDLADTVIDLVGTYRRVDDVVGLVARAVRRGVSVAEIARALELRPNAKGRALLAEILGEVQSGIESPIELRYRRDVEQRHGLPTAILQAPGEVDGRRTRTDAWYPDYHLRVELDGEPGHPGGRTAQDTWRDNHMLVASGDATLRYRWVHLAMDHCGTAVQVGQALCRGGWTGTPRACGDGCAVRFARWHAA